MLRLPPYRERRSIDKWTYYLLGTGKLAKESQACLRTLRLITSREGGFLPRECVLCASPILELSAQPVTRFRICSMHENKSSGEQGNWSVWSAAFTLSSDSLRRITGNCCEMLFNDLTI